MSDKKILVFRVRVPKDRCEEIKEDIKDSIKHILELHRDIEIIINEEVSDNNCYNCGYVIEASYGSSCGDGINIFDTCKLSGKNVDKNTTTEIIYDDGHTEMIETEDYIGNKGCNYWKPKTQ